jgi:glycosyltransferase involved in cell wall biosynthesis
LSGKPTISVILITLNEERNIDRCLSSVRWADEIIVVDSFSSDATVERARRYTPHVFQNEYLGSTKQMEWGIGRARGDWILLIDGDEEVSPGLAVELQSAARDTTITGFELLRKPWAFGRWIGHGGWFPDYQLRFFRRDAFTVTHEEVHGGFSTRGPRSRLHGLVYHYTYESIAAYLERMNDYTSLQVSNRLKRAPAAPVRWYNLVLSPVSHFLRMFISRKGYRDGMNGFLLASLDALYSMALYAKVWEYRMKQQSGAPLPPITNKELNSMKNAR